MSRSKFLVIKLNDLKLPLVMLVIALAAFFYFMLEPTDTTQTFAPEDTYEDGMYIASISFSDAHMDVVVNVLDEEITSIVLDGFDSTEQAIYQDLHNSLSFVNDYVTSTQSLEFPEGSTSMNASTSILMDAVKIALSEDQDATITSTYHTPLLEQITVNPLSEDVTILDEMSPSQEQSTEPEVAVEVFTPTSESDLEVDVEPSSTEETSSIDSASSNN